MLTPERTLCGLKGTSKKRILELASEIIAEQCQSLSSEEVFAGLLGRERLGSTGIGDGVAIPHCRLGNCQEAVGYLVTLENGIDFDAIDSKPVDLIFILVVPEEACDEHLQTLASAAELFSQESVRQQLRNSSDNLSLYNAISGI